MNAKERAHIAMSGGRADRVPVIPQICPSHAIRVAGLPFRETVVDHLRDPRKYDLLVADCAHNYGVDGFRVWIGAEPVSLEWDGDDACQVDPETGEELWREPLPRDCKIAGDPAGPVLYIANSDGSIVALAELDWHPSK